MKLAPLPVTSQSMAGLGWDATPEEGPAPEGDFSFAIAAPELGLPGGLCAGRLECAPRPARLARMERHLRTAELLSAVEGDSILFAAPPQEAKGGRLVGVRALFVPKGKALVLAPGAWHWIPFPIGEKASRFLVVFRNRTGDEDLEVLELAVALEAESEGGTR